MLVVGSFLVFCVQNSIKAIRNYKTRNSSVESLTFRSPFVIDLLYNLRMIQIASLCLCLAWVWFAYCCCCFCHSSKISFYCMQLEFSFPIFVSYFFRHISLFFYLFRFVWFLICFFLRFFVESVKIFHLLSTLLLLRLQIVVLAADCCCCLVQLPPFGPLCPAPFGFCLVCATVGSYYF